MEFFCLGNVFSIYNFLYYAIIIPKRGVLMSKSLKECKDVLKEALKNADYKNGLSVEVLKEEIAKITQRYIDLSVSLTKSKLMEFIFLNAAVAVHPEDLFATELCHGGLMSKFLGQREKSKACLEIAEASKKYERTNTIRASMDFGHIAPDWQYVLDKGIVGIIEDLSTEKEKYLPDTAKFCYCSERIAVFEAMKALMLRFSEIAKENNSEKSDFVYQNLVALANEPPRTMAQAMQLVLLFYVLQTNIDTVICRSLGGLDRMLYPFYKNDLESGSFTKEQLAEITDHFLWKISCMEVTANMPFYISGKDERGEDATNEFTYFILERYRALDIYDPKIHVMYHDGIDKRLVRLVLEMIREGKNSFVFMNTKAASLALESIGVEPEDAKRVIVYGCYEPAAEATEIPCTCAGKINLAKSVELAIKNADSFESFDEFYGEVLSQLESYTVLCMDTIASYEEHYADICPSMLMSPTYRHSRERALDVYSGGAKYNNTSIVGSGLATLVDSLIAVKKLVFEEKHKSFGELKSILLANWEDTEKLRLMIKAKYPKFGNCQPEADGIASDVYNRFADIINNRPNGRGGVFRCGMFSVDWRFWMGAKMGATPDGRLAGEAISKNLAAAIGQDKRGVTAYLNSLTRLDPVKVPDGYVADVCLHVSAVKGEDGMAAFEGLLLTFMKKGGFSVHFNILSPDTLVNAQREPEKYKNLQIRLCGWNVRFVELDKAQQDEFILQSTNSLV